jgi:sterol desaturase/sphingolipid hydroxylase (fatty acid hydroxylase superfamily)
MIQSANVLNVIQSGINAAWALLPELAAFLLLAAIVHRRNLTGMVKRLLPPGAHVNVLSFVLDVLMVAPLLAVVIGWMQGALYRPTVGWLPSLWHQLPAWGVILAAVFVGDGIAYFRHRLEHSRWLWPFHAMHHSDREMTWFTLYRFHPLNRLSTLVIDMGALLLLGFPPWVMFFNALIRHYYGLLIHADVPWTYGRLGRIFVSPAMHRWHHVRQGEGIGSNFATVFSVFDQWFGTYYVPSPCREPLGLPAPGYDSFVYQLWEPFGLGARRWLKVARGRRDLG